MNLLDFFRSFGIGMGYINLGILKQIVYISESKSVQPFVD